MSIVKKPYTAFVGVPKADFNGGNAKNAAVKSQIRTAARKTVEAVQAGAVEEAKQALVHATSVIDKAASKGVLHKNTAARKKSNLAAKVNAL